MNIEEERKNWKHDEASVETAIKTMVDTMEKGGGTNVTLMAIDTVYRPFIQLIHSAHRNKVDPWDVRDAAMRLINMMIMETCLRVGSMNEEGKRMDLVASVREFVQGAAMELQADLEHMILTSVDKLDS